MTDVLWRCCVTTIKLTSDLPDYAKRCEMTDPSRFFLIVLMKQFFRTHTAFQNDLMLPSPMEFPQNKHLIPRQYSELEVSSWKKFLPSAAYHSDLLESWRLYSNGYRQKNDEPVKTFWVSLGLVGLDLPRNAKHCLAKSCSYIPVVSLALWRTIVLGESLEATDCARGVGWSSPWTLLSSSPM